MQSEFSFTTRQAAQAVGNCTAEAIRAQHRRTGKWRGVTPTVLPNGRLLWPRAEVLALAGKLLTDHRLVIDLRATSQWAESRGLPWADVAVQAMGVALNDPRDDEARDAQVHLEDCLALKGWVDAQVRRINAARHRMTSEQRDDCQRLLARALAPAWRTLDEGAISLASTDVCGEAP